ncbi:hybrid sensor histidine kinase/response regulator [Odoribacter splanchnicus]|jgi:two-component system sensor histidine kinase/response regulator|uniref:histidine kinase n=1 Tax=Odoribacter splanchnicus TaxID=28118 RepID=A0A412TSP1_9BACT|nr:hybrid sensor histidine kinase/response regulator [Odoribacter splanchnicus]RGU56640.1 hybrid sensor histidine kinase/response regulator [Odoribacter splanchnicus]
MQINPAEFKLLVVDDVQTNVLLLKALLSKDGYGILVANNGQEALEVIRNENPDLILLDVMMPGMDGFEVAERLKSEEYRCEIPIIFLTALDDTQSIVNGFKLGAGDFISKPFRKEELMVRIKHQLSLVAARRIIEEKNEELRKTIAGRDKMYSVIAHDLRSPMASMKMLLNTIMMSVEKDKIDPDIFDMLEMSNKTSEEVFSLLDNLLKWTKSQLGKLTVIPQKLDISGLADGVVEVMNSVAEVKHIKLIRTDHESFFVYVDIEMIKSVLRNLISNAVKFSNPDSDIKVGIKAEDGKVIVSVTDSGKGIKKEDQHKLLKDSTHFTTYGTNSEEGSGLGLLLCRDFARKNGGELWFESEENLGSVFSFSLPQLIA